MCLLLCFAGAVVAGLYVAGMWPLTWALVSGASCSIFFLLARRNNDRLGYFGVTLVFWLVLVALLVRSLCFDTADDGSFAGFFLGFAPALGRWDLMPTAKRRGDDER